MRRGQTLKGPSVVMGDDEWPRFDSILDEAYVHGATCSHNDTTLVRVLVDGSKIAWEVDEEGFNDLMSERRACDTAKRLN